MRIFVETPLHTLNPALSAIRKIFHLVGWNCAALQRAISCARVSKSRTGDVKRDMGWNIHEPRCW